MFAASSRAVKPVTVRVTNETGAPVNCVLAVFAFKVIVGFWTFVVAQNAGQALPGAVVVSVVFTVLAMPASFRADLAWGTLDLSRTLVGADDRIGFRDLAASTFDFAWIVGTTASTACTAAACEMRIPTASLGPSASPRTIRLFARIVNSNGMMSPNQTLPMDDMSAPRVVTMLLEVAE